MGLIPKLAIVTLSVYIVNLEQQFTFKMHVLYGISIVLL